MGYSNETLRDLILALDKGLKEIGVPDNKKYFSNELFFGNISVCRFTKKPSQEFLDKIRELKDINIGELLVKEISLVACNEVCNPNSRKIVGTYRLK